MPASGIGGLSLVNLFPDAPPETSLQWVAPLRRWVELVIPFRSPRLSLRLAPALTGPWSEEVVGTSRAAEPSEAHLKPKQPLPQPQPQPLTCEDLSSQRQSKSFAINCCPAICLPCTRAHSEPLWLRVAP